MEDIRELVASALARVAKGLKLSPTQLQRIQAWKGTLEQSKLDANDRIEDLKKELRVTEGRIRKLGDEYDREENAVKEVVGRQLQAACVELDKKKGKMDVLFANLEAATAAVGKIEQLEEAMKRGITEDQADGLAVELEEAIDALDRSDEAIRGAEKVSYKQAEGEKVDVGERVRALKSAPASLSPQTANVLERLRQPRAERE